MGIAWKNNDNYQTYAEILKATLTYWKLGWDFGLQKQGNLFLHLE